MAKDTVIELFLLFVLLFLQRVSIALY